MFNPAPVLEAMQTNLERGAFSELRFLIDFYRQHVTASAEIGTIEKFEQICALAQPGIDHEEKHGRWSLLDRDHPATRSLRTQGFYKDLFPEAA
jgi:hypothetical protein